MPKLIVFFILLAGFNFSVGEEIPPKEKATDEMPSIEECIPESISKLGPPAAFPFRNGLVTAVSAATEDAQRETVQGLNHLHGDWAFEAMRHFAIAMKEDPRCLMAHWGMIMSMLSSSPETDPYRLATTRRMLELINDGEGTELERGYAYGLIKYIEEGPNGAANAFRKVADKFPSDIQAQIFASLFGRTGYDDLGTATADQTMAEQRLLKLIEKLPNGSLPLNALLLIRSDVPDPRPSLELAQKLCELVPDYAPYFYVLGHYEWRCGEHAKAISAFERASALYAAWMEENKVTPTDCSGWIRAQCYRAVALASEGDFETALASAKKIAAIEIDATRPYAWGTRELLWDGKTLPARILMRRSLPGDPEKALAALPTPAEGAALREKSLSYWWVDGLRISLEAQRLLDAGKLDRATETIAALTFHGQAMLKRQAVAGAIGERSEWLRSFHSLEVLAAELRGRLALAGPAVGHGSAFNWFRAAADRQTPSTTLSPPPILTPMAMLLGDYFITTKQPSKAVEAYEEALKKFPNDKETSIRLEKARIMEAKSGEQKDATPPED